MIMQRYYCRNTVPAGWARTVSGVLRAAGETIISEYSIFYGTLLPSAYTPKRWVDREARED